MSQNKQTRRLIYLSLLIAMNIVFVRLLSFQTPVTRLDFGFVPISLAGALFGPFWGALAGGASDILGMLVNSKGMAYFFPWTLNAVLHGFFYGLFLYRKQKTWLRIISCVMIQGIFVNLLLGSIWATIYRGNWQLFPVVMGERLLMVVITVPVQILVIQLLCRVLKPHIKEL
ncbi:MAG: folate family ECF transporter S component [Clostridia bacterium]|nr:folate family ECF transporter S component [Clostridia bacterium]